MIRRPLLLAGLISAGACGVLSSQAASEGEVLDRRFEETYVTSADRVRLYVRVVGTGPDTVVIPAAAWLGRDLTRLARGRTLIFFDPRARGGSDFVMDTARLGIEHDVRDIEAVRSHFNVDRMSLVGWSYLGAAVVLYAAEHADRVDRIVQIGPMAPRTESSVIAEQRGSPPDSTDLAVLADLVDAGVPDANPILYCREYVMRRIIRPMMGRPVAAARAQIDPCMYWNEWPSQLFRTAAHVIPEAWDYSELARGVTAPVLTVHGTDDPNAAVEGGREWVTFLPNARLVEIQGVGHMPWLEAPDEFFSEVEQFLASEEGGA